MARVFLTPINLSKLELQNAVIQVLAADPSTPAEGQVYYNSVTKKLRQYNGTTWTEYGTSTATGDVSQSSASGGAGRMKVSAGADKTIADLSGVVGIIKTDTNGVVSAATAGTDYVTAASTTTFTNKTFDANGTGNSISNIETADFASGVIDTSTSLASNSDTKIPTQKAVKAYVDGLVTGLLDYKGALDASASPNYPAASKGDVYRISVAGKVGGASGTTVEVGDEIIANADNAGGTEASVGTSWDKIQGNINPASTTVAGYVELATQAEAEAKSSSTLAVTPASLTTFTRKYTATIGDGSTTAIAVTHGLGSIDQVSSVRDATTNVEVFCDVTYGATTTTFTFATAPASNAYKIVLVG